MVILSCSIEGKIIDEINEILGQVPPVMREQGRAWAKIEALWRIMVCGRNGTQARVIGNLVERWVETQELLRLSVQFDLRLYGLRGPGRHHNCSASRIRSTQNRKDWRLWHPAGGFAPFRGLGLLPQAPLPQARHHLSAAPPWCRDSTRTKRWHA